MVLEIQWKYQVKVSSRQVILNQPWFFEKHGQFVSGLPIFQIESTNIGYHSKLIYEVGYEIFKWSCGAQLGVGLLVSRPRARHSNKYRCIEAVCRDLFRSITIRADKTRIYPLLSIRPNYITLTISYTKALKPRHPKHRPMISTKSPVLAGPRESAVFKVLNILENQAAKLSQSQVFRPISLNLQEPRKVRTTRRLSCISQMFLDPSILILSYYRITMLRMVRRNLLINHIPFTDFSFSPPPQVLLSLELTTSWETQFTYTRMNRSLIELHGRPSPGNKLRRFSQSGSRKSGKFMVDIIDTKWFSTWLWLLY